MYISGDIKRTSKFNVRMDDKILHRKIVALNLLGGEKSRNMGLNKLNMIVRKAKEGKYEIWYLESFGK